MIFYLIGSLASVTSYFLLAYRFIAAEKRVNGKSSFELTKVKPFGILALLILIAMLSWVGFIACLVMICIVEFE